MYYEIVCLDHCNGRYHLQWHVEYNQMIVGCYLHLGY